MLRIVAVLAVMLAAAMPALAQPQFDDPRALIEFAYEPYMRGEPPEDPAALFSPTLRQLWDDALSRSADGPVIDFDPFVNAQDYELSDLIVADPVIEGDNANVVVSFSNFGGANELRFTLVRRAEGWKIDDIQSQAADFPWRLSELLAADPMLN